MEYPSYQEIEEYVTQHPEYLKHWPVYSDTYHARMAKIFAVILDKLEWRERPSLEIHVLGLQILNCGGETAKTGCFEIFYAAMMLLHERHTHWDYMEMRERLQFYWYDVDAWVGPKW